MTRKLAAPERKAQIVDAAVDLFAQSGFQGVTTRQLAAAVGVTEPVLYQHFATKRALYDAILDARCEEGEMPSFEEIESAGEPRQVLHTVAGLLLDWTLQDPRYTRILMFSALEGTELAALFYEKHIGVFYDWLTAYLQRAMDAGKLRRIDPLVAARSFVGMIYYQSLIYAVFRPGDLPTGREGIVNAAVDIFLEGTSL